MKNQQGYSLFELIFVITLIGLLMSAAIPSYLAIANKARVLKARMDVQTISQAVEIHALETGVYPNNLNQLLLGGDHARMAYIPLDPWNHAYRYINRAVVSYGADNQPGGTGYNTDISSAVNYIEL